MRRNPYLNRSMIRELDQFHGRLHEIERIMARIGAPMPQSVSIVGERRVGKSSLLWRLCQEEIYTRYLENPHTYLFILLDFQGYQHLDLAGFCRVFDQHLEAAAGGPGPEAGAGCSLAALEEAVRQLSQQGRRLVCLFDEFEAVTRNPAFGPEFFGFLRSLANAYPVAFVTASRRDLQTLCHTQQIAESPFFNIFAQVHLGPLLGTEVAELISLPSARAGVPLEPHRDAIVALGGHLPFYLQIACSAALECAREDGELDGARLEQRFMEEAAGHFRYLWEHLEAGQREVVGCLAAGTAPPLERARDVRSLEADGLAAGGRLFSRALARFVKEVAPEAVPPAPEPTRPARPRRPPDDGPAQVEPTAEGAQPFPQIVGQSAPMRRVFALMQRAIASDVPILLLGETGTGKELVARTIHEYSRQRGSPFVPVNCGAIAEHLQESELFGHRKGAFTGAVSDQEGLVEAAHQGTLFLDEVSETTPATQVKLLRALQDGEVRRVGETHTRKVQVRLICASNADLETEVAEGRFRPDLYYRLYVLLLYLPALRERRSDIPLLAEHFLHAYPAGIDPEALRLLQGYAWPGNTRELENQLASAGALAGGGRIQPGHLWPRVRQQQALGGDTGRAHGDGVTLKEAREEFERDYVLARLVAFGWNMEETSRSLGVSRSWLYGLIGRHGLKEG